MLQYKWYSTTIRSNKQANGMIQLFRKLQPKVGAFDTETTGLHITEDKPFLVQFGFIDPNKAEGYTFAVDLERQPDLARQVLTAWNILAQSLDIYLGHNVKFDLHMLANIGLPYTKENVSDTMFYIRYAHDALTPANGGPPLGLKDYSAKYIDPNAKYHEKLLSTERTDKAKEINNKLKMRTGKSLGYIKDLFSDPIVDYNDLPEDIKPGYLKWLRNDVPLYLQNKVQALVSSDMIRYNTLDRENLIKYAHYDIIYTIEIYLKLKDIVTNRGNDVGLDFENKLIFPLYEMERVGFYADKQYLEEARIKLKNYIKERREVLYELAGQKLGIGQHALIKSILTDMGVTITSTNSNELDLLKSNLIRQGNNPKALEFINVMQELRTLEKWYSAYITRFINDLQRSNRLYTTINQVGTVSGRVTSDFQQFPKDAIKTKDGEEIFQPRKMVKPTGGEYNAIVYLDYSQIELRFQALYTILVGTPDTNLCRAYMPFKCINPQGNTFNYNSPADISNWNGEWYYEENPTEHWEPTDVHAATTTAATGLKKGDPGFKEARSAIGKRTNFAKNYGAKYNKIREMFPDKTEEEVKKIDDAYYTAFPGVKTYHNYCYSRAEHYASTTNIFGVKYYGVNGHKLVNMLIQGSAAYYLKWKIREIYDYCKENNIKSRFQMNIHDELSWERHISDGPELFFEFKRIMQDWQDAMVPIVAEMDATNTTWSGKKGVDTYEELQTYLCS